MKESYGMKSLPSGAARSSESSENETAGTEKMQEQKYNI